MGTELMATGVPLDVCFEELNVTRPELVSGVHNAYVAAGARVLETNTFGGNEVRLSRHGLESRGRELNQAAVRLGRKAIGARAIYLAASIGPLGLEYDEAQTLNPAQIFGEQIEAILEEGVDLFFFETFQDLEEIQIALKALRERDSKIPAICSMVCSEEGRLPSSLPIVQAFPELVRRGANVVGINCVTGPNEMLRILKRIPPNWLLSAFPNGGYPRYHEGRFIYNAAPEYFGASAAEFAAQGANLIGGCCGVGPQHVREMAKALAGLKPVRSKPVITWATEPLTVKDTAARRNQYSGFNGTRSDRGGNGARSAENAGSGKVF